MTDRVKAKAPINTSPAWTALLQHRDTNPFDQWGVELGKQLAGQLQNGPSGKDVDSDYSTRGLMAFAGSKHKHK